MAISYLYYNYSNKQKNKDVDKKFEMLFNKYCQLEQRINDINFKIQDINEIVEEIEYTTHLAENKNKSQSANNIQSLNNIDEYIMLVK